MVYYSMHTLTLNNPPKLISRRTVRHKNWHNGVRIGEVQLIEKSDGTRVEINLWYNADGTLHHVGNPIPVKC